MDGLCHVTIMSYLQPTADQRQLGGNLYDMIKAEALMSKLAVRFALETGLL